MSIDYFRLLSGVLVLSSLIASSLDLYKSSQSQVFAVLFLLELGVRWRQATFVWRTWKYLEIFDGLCVIIYSVGAFLGNKWMCYCNLLRSHKCLYLISCYILTDIQMYADKLGKNFQVYQHYVPIFLFIWIGMIVSYGFFGKAMDQGSGSTVYTSSGSFNYQTGYWNSTYQSFLTVFQIITGDWWLSHIGRPAINASPWVSIYMISITLISRIFIPSLCMAVVIKIITVNGMTTGGMSTSENRLVRKILSAADKDGIIHRMSLKKLLRNSTGWLTDCGLSIFDCFEIFDILETSSIIDTHQSSQPPSLQPVYAQRFAECLLRFHEDSLGHEVACLDMASEDLKLKCVELQKMIEFNDSIVKKLETNILRIAFQAK
jgi:hypothetical protein